MTAESILAKGRERAESLHTDTFTVYRPTGEMVEDPVTLKLVPEYATVHSRIKGKYQAGQAQPRDIETPGVKIAETSPQWHCSVSVTGILTDDEVECDEVDPKVGDPDLVGTRVKITGPFLKSHATARRFPVSEQT